MLRYLIVDLNKVYYSKKNWGGYCFGVVRPSVCLSVRAKEMKQGDFLVVTLGTGGHFGSKGRGPLF